MGRHITFDEGSESGYLEASREVEPVKSVLFEKDFVHPANDLGAGNLRSQGVNNRTYNLILIRKK
jgi:hypothetical protein